MISIDEALCCICEHARPHAAVLRPAANSLGAVLAEEIVAAADAPSYARSMVDGYAVIAEDLACGSTELAVIEEITAGEWPQRVVTSGCTSRVMTGAPLPAGASAVVMLEETVSVAGSPPGVRFSGKPPTPGQNVLREGTLWVRGERLLAQGHPLGPAEVGLLAELGREHVAVHRPPTVAVLATGNELIPPGAVPIGSQIRNSNAPMLRAQLIRQGAQAWELPVARDDSGDLARLVRFGLQADVLVLSGGVSAGVLDLVPKTLRELGVRELFHKVRLRPGKPLWFGIQDDSVPPRLVFGLPGNPVSSFVCCEVFVRTAVRRLAGHGEPSLSHIQACLSEDVSLRGDRETLLPAQLAHEQERAVVRPLRWAGSADLRALTSANSLLRLPATRPHYRRGERVSVLLL